LFFDECRRICQPSSTAEERRSSETVFASAVVSISSLVELATKNLYDRDKSGELKEMPPIPSEEWVRLQFSPNNHTVEKARYLTGVLGLVRAVQSRTLRKKHEDQHWVNAMNKYVYEWLIELKSKGVEVEFFWRR